MTRYLLLAATCMVLLALLTFIASHYTGMRAQQEYMDFVRQAENQVDRLHLRLEPAGYERGIFSSSAETILLAEEAPEDPLLLLRHDIEHGPLLLGERLLGLARMETESRIKGELADSVDTAFDGKSPLLVSTEMAFDGTIYHRLNSPEANWQEQGRALQWGGLQGSATFPGGDAGSFSVDVHAPLIRGENSNAGKELFLKDLHIQGDSALDPDRGIRHVHTELNLGRFLAGKGEESLGLESFSFQSEAGLENGFLSFCSLESEFQGLRLNELFVSQAMLEARAENVDTQSLSRLLDDDSWQPLQQSLSSSPSLQVKSFHIRTSAGEMRMLGSASYNGTGGAPHASMDEIAQRLRAEVRISLPEQAALKLASIPAEALAFPFPDNGASHQERRKARAEIWLEGLILQGFISREEDRYRARLTLRDGIVFANDNRLLSLKHHLIEK